MKPVRYSDACRSPRQARTSTANASATTVQPTLHQAAERIEGTGPDVRPATTRSMASIATTAAPNASQMMGSTMGPPDGVRDTTEGLPRPGEGPARRAGGRTDGDAEGGVLPLRPPR